MAISALLDLRLGTWEEAAQWVGRRLRTVTGADEVTIADIRRRLEVLAWDCPIHYDEGAARSHGYRGVVAPATMLMTWSMDPYWEPGDRRPELNDPAVLPPLASVPDRVPAPGEFMFVTSVESEYHESVYPGDRISASAMLLDLKRKRLSIGDGAFFTIETSYSKQTGEVVGVERLTIFRYSPSPDGEAACSEEDRG